MLARLGERTDAERISVELERIEEADWRLINQARIAAALGDRDRAVRLIRRMTMRGYLHQEVEFEELKGYPPFEELQRPRG